jgi:LuxR family maltose regulon positive regulatory protein
MRQEYSSRAVQAITNTKVSPPRSARRLMARDALISRLMQARRNRCIVVQGPAGSGKTSTLVAWRAALLSLDFDVAWLSLAAEDNDIARFPDCLLASLAEIDAELVREPAVLVGRGSDESALEHWAITLVLGISRRRRELVLMLDDMHHIKDPLIAQTLQWLVDYAPPQLHIALTSRSALPLSLGRLRTRKLVTELDMRDLRFSAGESEQFLREQLGAIDRRDAAVLHELTDGWVAGLQLFAVDLRSKPDGHFARVQVRDARAFGNYFEREVLVRLASDDLELLTRAAICNRFCVSLCAALSPSLAGPVAFRLAHLNADNFFISQVNDIGDEAWYRLHPLLREVLLGRLSGWPADEQRSLHIRAWKWFIAQGHLDEAIHHAARAGDLEAAADMVEACADRLLMQGNLTQLASLMRILPREHIRARFDLHMAMAHLYMYSRNLDELASSLQQFESQFDTLSEHQRYAIFVLRGGLAVQNDESDAVAAILPELENIPPDASAFAWMGRSNILAWMYMYRDEYAQARQILGNEDLRHNSPRSALLGRCMTGMSLALEGRMAQAEKILQEALQEAQQRATAYAGVELLAAGLLADTLYESNEIGAACRLLEQRVDMQERVSSPDGILRALVVLAASQWIAGRTLEAYAYLDRLEDYAARYALTRLRAYALMMRSRWQLQRGEQRQGHAALRELEALAELNVMAVRGTKCEIGICAQRARIEMCLHENDFDGALSRLDKLIAQVKSKGRQRLLSGLLVQSAVAQRGSGHREKSEDSLLQAVRLGHRLRLARSLLDVSPQVPEMLRDLAQCRMLDPVLAFYVANLQASRRSQGEEFGPQAAGEPNIGPLGKRECEVLGLVGQAMPNKKIAQVLNISPETVKWHLKNIYCKLGVNGRDEAVARSRDLALELPTWSRVG